MLVSVFDKELPANYAGMALDSTFLGGKGFGLWWMQQQGVNVPPALIIPTTVCLEYKKKPKTVMKEIAAQFTTIEKFFKEKFGYMPLLSVRSGARASMPGMMDTILNVGLTDFNVEAWVARLGGQCVADSEKRLHHMYRDVVGVECPDNLKGQLLGAIEAVFKSWDNERAIFYRKMNNIPDDWGTAVVLQAMVFGNMNDQSCTGVLFTRNPDSGTGKVVGEYLVNAQGEDVVAGIRTPQNLSEMDAWNPGLAAELLAVCLKLEEARTDVQDIEFTVQDNKLYILQTRNAKRSARAAVKIAVDMATENLITPEVACTRVTMKELDLAQQSILDPDFKTPESFTGIPACSGVVTGVVALTAEAAINCKVPCILVTAETTPDDIAGMNSAKGVLTMTGGSTSHAAVVARGMNKPCVVGLSQDIKLFIEGDTISFDGATGRVWMGKVPVIDGSSNPDVHAFKELCWKTMAEPVVRILDAPDAKLPVQAIRMSTRLSTALPEFLAQVASIAQNSSRVVLDLTPLHPVEDSFYSIFLTPEARTHNAAEALLELAKTPGADKLVTLGGPHMAGIKTIKTLGDLAALVLADEEAIWVGENDEATAKVMKWRASEGVKFSTVGGVSEAGTSYLSESQMLNLVLA